MSKTPAEQDAGFASAKTLAEALPFIQVYDREIVVIKYGGHAMGEEEVARLFAADVVLLKLVGAHPVVVHGGGPQISRMLERTGVKSTFVDGLRVTDAATMEIAEMVLSGAVNKEIVNYINAAGREADVRGVGLSGKDARLITVEKAVKSKRDPDTDLEQHHRPGLRRRAQDGGPPDRQRADPRQRGLHPRHRPHRRVRRGPDLQRQRRRGGRRHGRGAEGQAHAAAHRRAGRARQERRAHRAADDRARRGP